MSEFLASEDDLTNCLLFNTIRAARALNRRYDARLAPYGITVAQFSVMTIVRHNPGKTIIEAAEKIAMDRSAFSRNVDLLVGKKLVEKLPAGKGNARTCRLTAAGDKLLDSVVPRWQAAREEMRALMAGQDPHQFVATLQALTRG